MRILFWIGLLLVVLGIGSFFAGLPSPQQATGHAISVTVRVVVFLVGLSCVLAGAVSAEPVR